MNNQQKAHYEQLYNRFSKANTSQQGKTFIKFAIAALNLDSIVVLKLFHALKLK